MLHKSLIAVGTLFTLVLVGLFAPVYAQTQSITISIPDTTVVREPQGSTTLLETVNVDQDMVGMVCGVEAVAKNQTKPSVHPDNDLVVASGDSNVTLEDVENAAGAVTTATGTLTLGDTISVSLVMGEDEVFSGGLDVTVTCEKPTEVTANVEFVDECGVENDSFSVEDKDGVNYDVDDQRVDGVGIVTVTATADEGHELEGQSEFSHEFTNEPCEQPTEKVCRDGEIVTITEGERLETDQDAPCPEVGEQPPAELPNTGIGAVAATVAGSTSIFAGVRSWAKSRSQMKSVLSNR